MLYGCLLSSLEIKALVADKKEVERFMIPSTETLESPVTRVRM